MIYLPRGPLWSNEEQEASIISQLGQHLPSHHIVRINYRLSPHHQYPTPVHDTLAGFDWILENILRKRAISRPGRADHVGRIGVCGELIGGGLASMLALTECRIGEPGVIAAAVNNPLVDWVSLDGMQQPDADATLESDSTVGRLLDLRHDLFSKPDRYFDPFASPMLLFRTSGTDVPPPPAEAVLDDMALLSLHERERYAKEYATTSADPKAVAEAIIEASASPAIAVPRKASRRFPSVSLNLRLPSFHISSGSLAPFNQQSEDFTHVIRQSIIRQARQTTTGSSFGRKMLLDDEEDEFEDEREKEVKARQKADAEEKAQFRRHQGLGLWDGSKEGQARVRDVAKWLGEKMG